MTADAGRDTVAIFATANHEPDPARLQRARRYFEARGYRVDCHLADGGHHQRFAGTDDERLRWLHATIDAAPAIAVAQRGGYGATRLLPRIRFDAMADAVARGTRFVGHSDFTALSLGLLATTGAISFAGPMASFGFGGDTIDPFTETQFWRAIDESRVDLSFDAPQAADVAASGLLWGGNLAMIASLVGTPWLPDVDGGILFVEDVNEQPYRIERMLLQLAHAGILDRQRLVLCGTFNGYRAADADHGYDVADALARVGLATRTPLVCGLPFGHVPRKATLAVGAEAQVVVAGGAGRLTQRWDVRPTA